MSTWFTLECLLGYHVVEELNVSVYLAEATSANATRCFGVITSSPQDTAEHHVLHAKVSQSLVKHGHELLATHLVDL